MSVFSLTSLLGKRTGICEGRKSMHLPLMHVNGSFSFLAHISEDETPWMCLWLLDTLTHSRLD